LTDGREVFSAAGFTGTNLDIILGIAYAESDGQACTKRFDVRSSYSDAVGDLGLINATWGPSIGLTQIRSLRDPLSGNAADRWRVAEKLRDPLYNAQAAWVISKQGTDFSLWSTFVHNTYLPYAGQDFDCRTGHPNALKWNS
jgi:hypothetical protein